MFFLSLGYRETVSPILLTCINPGSFSVSLSLSLLSRYSGQSSCLAWVTVERLMWQGNNIIRHAKRHLKPAELPCDWTWKSTLWSLPTASWASLDSEPPAVTLVRTTAWLIPWFQAQERPWATVTQVSCTCTWIPNPRKRRSLILLL